MFSYILRRILLMIPTLIGMTFILFAIVRFAPGIASGGGDIGGGSMRNTQMREEMERARLRRLHMIDANNKPIPLPLQYTYWLWDSVRGDLGDSVQYHVSVASLVRDRLPVTLILNIISALIVYIVAIPGGLLSAAQRGRSLDVTWSFSTLALYSLPPMWVGALLVGYLANPQYLGWFPSAGLHQINTDSFTSMQYVRDYLWHLVLPLAVYTYAGFAYLSKLMRSSILENLGLDYARTARAKGLSSRTVLLRHVFRNSLLPLITTLGSLLPGLLAGSLIVERIFSIKGMGDLYVTAADARDLPVVQGVALIGSVLSLISLLATDLAYAAADPRVSYE